MIQTTRLPVSADWDVETVDLGTEMFYTVLYRGHRIAEVIDEAGTWSPIRRPSRDDPPIPSAVYAAIPHNEGLLRGLLYT